MLNPIKTPQEMLMEQANIPHYAAGSLVKGLGKELYQQFEKRIVEAIRRYTKATGKAPSPEEVAQLEQHIKSLQTKAPEVPQTQARVAAETPAANKLVDARGRPYSPMPSPKTGKLTTPEQAKGYTVKDQFAMEPGNMRAREDVYDPAHVNVFGEDPFLSMTNTGRLPSRTWMKSYTPSTEELAQREMLAAESGVDDAAGGLSRVQSFGDDGPSLPPNPIAERAGALEAPAMDKLSTEIMLGKHKDLVQRAVEDFRSKGIEPDEEDILNAVNAMINPLRHNYTGINPIGDRPAPPRGRPSLDAEAKMNAWRDQGRASGLPETVVSDHPDKWPQKHRQDYLMDVEPQNRAPFSKNWELDEYADGGMVNAMAMTPAAGGLGVMANPASPLFDKNKLPNPMFDRPVVEPLPMPAQDPFQTIDANRPKINPIGVGPFRKGGGGRPNPMFDRPVVKPLPMSPRDMQARMMVQGYAGGKAVKKPEIDYGLGRAAIQGLTMGWGDEGEAALRSMFGDSSYDENLAAIQQSKKQFEQKYPNLAMGAEIAGSIPTFFVPGMNATSIPRMAAMGAVYGMGSADPGERLEGAGYGAAAGAGLGKATQLAGKGVGKVYNAVRRRGINPEARIAEEYTQRPFDFRSGMKAQSTPERQEWIGRAHEYATRENYDPAYKAAVYAAWLKHNPEMVRASGAQNYDQLMEAAYRQSAKETKEQFGRIPNRVRTYGDEMGSKRDYLSRAANLGQKPAEFMRSRLREGKPFDIYAGGDPHPALSQVDPATGLNANEMFRAVHDYFGHLGPKTPNTFGPRGEENAWIAHKQMYSPLAEPALTAETRGQNSFVNYVDPVNVALRKQGKPTTQYARNKPALLPPEASNPEYAGGVPEYLRNIIK